MLTAERLRELVRYDPVTGLFYRRWKCGERRVGCDNGRGYVVLRLDDKLYQAHRLAWLYVHGVFPAADIDHINGVRDDNRIVNLRPATRAENLRHKRHRNKTGCKGVMVHRDANRKKRYGAQMAPGGAYRFLGWFAALEEAARAYQVAAQREYGDFAKW